MASALFAICWMAFASSMALPLSGLMCQYSGTRRTGWQGKLFCSQLCLKVLTAKRTNVEPSLPTTTPISGIAERTCLLDSARSLGYLTVPSALYDLNKFYLVFWIRLAFVDIDRTYCAYLFLISLCKKANSKSSGTIIGPLRILSSIESMFLPL